MLWRRYQKAIQRNIQNRPRSVEDTMVDVGYFLLFGGAVVSFPFSVLSFYNIKDNPGFTTPSHKNLRKLLLLPPKNNK